MMMVMMIMMTGFIMGFARDSYFINTCMMWLKGIRIAARSPAKRRLPVFKLCLSCLVSWANHIPGNLAWKDNGGKKERKRRKKSEMN